MWVPSLGAPSQAYLYTDSPLVITPPMQEIAGTSAPLGTRAIGLIRAMTTSARSSEIFRTGSKTIT